MERTTIKKAKILFGKNFIGPTELQNLFFAMNFKKICFEAKDIPYDINKLKSFSKDYILIYGVSNLDGKNLSIRTFRKVFGIDPDISEPCFYNQDWYLKENFIDKTLENKWYLIQKDVVEETRAVLPENILKNFNLIFPSAILCVYTFFANYFINKNKLWLYDFVWCSDLDHNGDRIYVGKYHDIDGVNKDGFSIHRHLSLRQCYAAVKTL